MLPAVHHRPPEPDLELEAKLNAEGPEILYWAVQGCLEWQRVGLARLHAVAVATEEYFDEQDVFGEWLRDRCEQGSSFWEQPTHLYRDWSDYAQRIGEDSGSMFVHIAIEAGGNVEGQTRRYPSLQRSQIEAGREIRRR